MNSINDINSLAEDLMKSVEKAFRGVRAVFRSEIEEHNLTFPQFHLIRILRDQGSLTVTEISSSMMIAPPTASRMIDALCRKGFLRKEKSEHDRRVTTVSMTDKSTRILQRISRKQRQFISEILRREEFDEIKHCVSNLEKLADKWVELAEKSRGESFNE